MKHLRKVLLCMTVMLCIVSAHALASEGNSSFSIQEVILQPDGQMDLIVYVPPKTEISASRLALTLDGKSVSVSAVDSLSNSAYKTTWLLLSDRSTIGATTRLKTLMTNLIDLMNPGDNAGILVTGNGLDQISLTDDPLNLKALVESDLLKRKNQETALYATVATAIQYLNQSNQVQSRKCLIVISSGENASESGMTTNELQDLIKESPVTVYTFTLQDDSPQNTLINRFESLARLSQGGMALSIKHSANESGILNTVTQVRENERCFRVVSCNPAKAGISGRELSLSLTDGSYSMTANFVLSAKQAADYAGILSKYIPTSKPTAAPTAKSTVVPTAAPTATPTAMPTATPTASPTAAPTAAPGFLSEIRPYFPILGIAAGVVLILILVLVFSKKKNYSIPDEPEIKLESEPESKHQSGPEPQPQPRPESQPQSRPEPQPQSRPEPQPQPRPESQPQPRPEPRPKPQPQSRPVPKAKPLVHVVFTECVSSVRYEADMWNTLIVGRDPSQANLLLNPRDTTISGIHLRLSYRDGIMKAKDISSNGTFINNRKIPDDTPLRNGERIRLASSEFIITWTPIQQ